MIISDRISKAIFHLGDDGILVLFNIYAPTQNGSKKHEYEREVLYDQLNTQITLHKSRKTTIIVAGDFNSKVGRKKNGEECMGMFTRGKRNDNGQHLVEFCEANKLYIANSHFRHRACHITTWEGYHKNSENLITPIYNQIDYILVPSEKKHKIFNARSYDGMQTSSDHRLVIATTHIDYIPIRKSPVKHQAKYDTSKLINDTRLRERYNELYDANMKAYSNTKAYSNSNASSKLTFIKKAITVAAEESIGTTKRSNNHHGSHAMDELSNKQKELRLKIKATKIPTKRELYKKERNHILHEIRKLAINSTASRLDKIALEIEEAKNGAQMFKAVRLLTRSKPSAVIVQNVEGKIIANREMVTNEVAKYFEEKLNNPNVKHLPKNDIGPLLEPITSEEVEHASKKLRNGRASGPDNIPSELLKYGSKGLYQDLASTLNDSFKHNDDLQLGEGTLIVLQKSGKPTGHISSLRPVVLLTALRKMLSIITLNRVRSNIESFLPAGQSGFRTNRSTADAVWAPQMAGINNSTT